MSMAGPSIILKVEARAKLSVRRVSAWEHISKPFAVDVVACSREPVAAKDKAPDLTGASIRLDWIIGRGAALRVEQDDGLHKVWTGICSHVEQVRFDETPGAESTYRLRIAPYLWLLSQRRNHRIFQHQRIPEIVAAIFDEWHLKYELRLDPQGYPKKEYCTQYGETDLDFVHRLLEEAGIVYFFEVRDVGGGKAQSFLVLTDAAHSQPPALELPFVSNPNEAQGTLYATNVHVVHQVRPGLYTLGDYDFRKPARPLIAKSQPAAAPEGTRERYAFRPGQFRVETAGPRQGPPDERHADDKGTSIHDVDGEGKARAQRFLEAERHKKRYVTFESSAQSLTAGMVVTITDHPHDELLGQRLLVLESMDHLDASGSWGAVAEAVFTDVPYRAPRRTPKPRVAGVHSAIVVGPPGKEIYTDEFGRVRVRFPWDRQAQFDDDATCWLRVASAWAGPQFGQLMIPRIGHEVIVDFLDGDPDEPVVVGRVYTQPAPVPYKLPDQKTRSVWQTNSTPSDKKSKKFNEIMLDDMADNELVYVQAERNFMSLVKHDETERTGQDRTQVVGRHRLGIVSHVDSTHVGKQHLVQMVKAKDLKILEMEDPKTKPRDTFVEVVDEKITLTTGKSTIVLDGPTITVAAKGGIRLSADKNFVVKGTKVEVNAAGRGVDAEADKKVNDAVPVPEDRRVNAVVQLLGDKYEAKKRADRGEIAIDALIGPPGQLLTLSDQPLKPVAPGAGAQQWKAEEVVGHMLKSKTARAIIEKRPPGVAIVCDPNRPEDSRGAYNRKRNVIRLAPDLSSAAAAPIVAHELLHAHQQQVQGRPTSFEDLLDMEVEAKNAGLDTYEELGFPPTDGYEDEWEFRREDQQAYDHAVREMYREAYTELGYDKQFG